MPAYRYRAVHSAGHVTRGTVAAANERELVHYLNHSGLELIEAREKKQPRQRLRLSRGLSPRALTVFCTQMTDLLKAGIPFVEGLRDLGESMEPGVLRDALADIVRNISHGSRIAASFARAPRLFPPIFIAILASGERSGDLAQTFAQLARYTETRVRMNDNLRRALRYPLFLFTVTVGVVVFMMTLVVPQIVLFLNSIDDHLPVATRALIAVSDIFAKTWWLLAAGLAIAILLTVFLRRVSDRAGRVIDTLILRVPFMGPVLHKLILARFLQSFAILLQSGIGIPASLRGARDTLGYRALESDVDEVGRQVQAGRALSVAMAGLLPPFAARIVRIGEHSGQLGKSFGDIAAVYDREAAEAVEALIGALEPALTLVVGGILAWVVMAVLGPIYGSLTTMNMMGG